MASGSLFAACEAETDEAEAEDGEGAGFGERPPKYKSLDVARCPNLLDFSDHLVCQKGEKDYVQSTNTNPLCFSRCRMR